MFKNPFSFNGRIRRTEFGISFIIYLVVYFITLSVISGDGANKIFGLLVIPTVWFLWAQAAKRCHDLGKSGWWQIIPFYVFWLLFQKGQPFDNEYDVGPHIYGAGDYVKPFGLEPEVNPVTTPVINQDSDTHPDV